MTRKTFKWDYLKKSPDTSGSDPNYFGNKKARISGLFLWSQAELLQLDFLVLNVLASFWVELHDRHFLGHCFLVLAGRVKMTSASC